MPKNNSLRTEKFLELFSRERQDVREAIAHVIPEYCELLGMHAVSFEEFALQEAAIQQGLPYTDPLFDYTTVKMPCPQCGDIEKVKRWKDGSFQCPSCKKRYKANAGSISANSNCPPATWLKVLHCLISQFTVEQTKAMCRISANTYYLITSKLFYAMSLILKDIKLYGLIEADITFVQSNYRGVDLQEDDYPENSLFDETKYIPRPARSRGGSYTNQERNKNSVAIFTAIDDRGHCFIRCAGLGMVTAQRLINCIPRDCFLATVPEVDPFKYMKKQKETMSTAPGTASLMVSDGEHAIAKYAAANGMPFESHVFRRNGKQVKLPGNAHNIQRVNALHSRLKKFLRGLNGVSSRYLPGYLTLFTFLECCGQSPEILNTLFLTLARPGLGQPPEFYKSLFTVPNIYVQWQDEKNPLKHLSYRQLEAFHLSDLRSRQLAAGDSNPITVSYITTATDLSRSSIRRIYKDLLASGYADLIRAYFDENDGCTLQRKQTITQSLICTDPVMLAVYDAWAEERRLPPDQRSSFKEFCKRMGAQHQREFKTSATRYHFNQIEKYGLRDPLPPLARGSKEIPPSIQAQIDVFNEYKELQLSYRKKGLPVPPADALFAIIAERHGITYEAASNMYYGGSKSKKLATLDK